MPTPIIMLRGLKVWASSVRILILTEVHLDNTIKMRRPTMPIDRNHKEKEAPKIKGGKGIRNPNEKMGNNKAELKRSPNGEYLPVFYAFILFIVTVLTERRKVILNNRKKWENKAHKCC